MTPLLQIRHGNQPWFGVVKFYTDKNDERFYLIKDYIKALPGALYESVNRSWIVPEEMIDPVIKEARDLGFSIREDP